VTAGQSSPPQFAGSYLSSGDAYALSQLTTSPPEAARSRPIAYYALLALGALALFAVSMFVTILVLR